MTNPFNAAKTDWTRARVEAPDPFTIGQTQRLSATKPKVYAPSTSTASTAAVTAPEPTPLTWQEQLEKNRAMSEQRSRSGGFAPSPTSAAVTLKTQQMLNKPLDPNLLSITGPSWEHWFKQALNQNFAYTYGNDFWTNFYRNNGITQT